MIGIESLSSGYLTHNILDPKVLARYLEAIADDMEDTAPDYEPVFRDVYQYYGNLLASFTNSICHDLRDLMGTKFFIIFVKYVNYNGG